MKDYLTNMSGIRNVILAACLTLDLNLSPAQQIQLNINSTPGPKVNPGLFGFSTESLFFNFDIDDQEYINLVRQLDGYLLRFPGGGISSIYHWDGEGYGIIREEAQQLNLMEKYLKQEELHTTVKYTDAFIKLAKMTHAKVLLVANVLTESPPRFLMMIDYLKKNDIELAGIELGSEVYLKKWKHTVRDIEVYLSLAKQFAAAIKNAYPDLRIGVVAAPSPLQDKSFSFLTWNEVLAKNDFYDAYIIHPYLVIKSCDEKENLPTRFDCASESVSKYLNEQFYAVAAYYHHLFGDKNIWISEWNISHFGNNGLYGNTNLQNLFAAEFLLSLAEFPSDKMTVEYAVYHNLSEKWLGFALINGRQKGEKIEPQKKYVCRSTYFGFLLLKRIFKKNTCLVKSELSWSDTINPDRRLRSAVFQNQDTTFIYLVNRSNQRYTLGDVVIDSKKLNPGCSAEYFSVYGNTLYASRGFTNFNPADNEPLYFQTDTLVIRELEIKPYSLNLLQLKRNDFNRP